MRRRLVILAGALAALSAFAVVQGADHCHSVSLAGAKIVRELGLSEAQKTQLEDIVRSNPPGPVREREAQNILTPEQWAKYQSLKRGGC